MIYNTNDSPFHPLESYDFNLSVWLSHWYPLICDYLKMDANNDYYALKSILARTKSNVNRDTLSKIIKENNVCIIAPGPSLEKNLDFLKTIAKNHILLAIDGATQFLIEKEIFPSVIVSDFDGDINAQLLAQKRGAILLLHIHGDNLHTINKYINKFRQYNFVITTQTRPLEGSFNFLGFSDGDRAVCFSHLMHAKEILLVGFDFGNEIGRYSKLFPLSLVQQEKKFKKFVIAKSIINWCANNNAMIKIRN